MASYFRRSRPSAELYAAIVKAERAAQEAHNLCYRDGGHGASPWLAMALGKAQSALMTQVVRFAGKAQPPHPDAPAESPETSSRGRSER